MLTASHNPAKYLGLKVKGAFGGSVTEKVTHKIEALLDTPTTTSATQGSLNLFDPWQSYCRQLRSQVNIDSIKNTPCPSGEDRQMSLCPEGSSRPGFRPRRSPNASSG